MANNGGGREVCDGTDQAVFEDSTACSGGTRVLGDSNTGLGTHEGMQGHVDTCVGIEAPTSLHLLVQEAWRRPAGEDGVLGLAELRRARPAAPCPRRDVLPPAAARSRLCCGRWARGHGPRRFVGGDRFKAFLVSDSGEDIDQSTGAEAMKPTPKMEEMLSVAA